MMRATCMSALPPFDSNPQRAPTYRQKSQITNHFHGNVYLLQLGHQHTEREKRASRMDNSKLLICHVFSSEIPEQTHIKTENS